MSNTKRWRFGLAGVGLAGALLSSAASASPVVFTEWMYNGDEFVEFTNLSDSAVDFTGWSFDDNSRVAGSFSLSGIGVLAPGASGIMSEASAAAFRTRWGLSSAVAVVGLNDQNLARSDEINLYDNFGTLVDRLTYNDEAPPGGIRTQNISGNPSSFAALGANNFPAWVLSANGDAFGAYTSATGGFVANPGHFVPLPAALPLLLSGLAGLAVIRRRRDSVASRTKG